MIKVTSSIRSLKMLSGNNDGILQNWDANNELELASHLGLSVRTDLIIGSLLANLSKFGSKICGKHVCKRHVFFSLIRGISEHDALITRTDIFWFYHVDRLCTIWWLLFYCNNLVTCFVVISLFWVVVPDIFDSVTYDCLILTSVVISPKIITIPHLQQVSHATRDMETRQLMHQVCISNLITEFVFGNGNRVSVKHKLTISL